MPPRIARYARQPAPLGAPIRKVSPRQTTSGVPHVADRPSMSAAIEAPVRQITVSTLNFNVGPETVISSAAASSGLPSARFARRNDRPSIGPDGGTPTFQRPTLPG